MIKPFLIGCAVGLILFLTYSHFTNLYNNQNEFIMATMKTCEDKKIHVFGDKEVILSKINDGKLKFNGHYFPIRSYSYEGGKAFMLDERCYTERLYKD